MLKFIVALLIAVSGMAKAQPTDAEIRVAIRQAGGPEPFMQEIARQTAKSLPTRTNANVEVKSVAANGRQLMYVTRLVNVEKTSVYNLEALKRSNINYSGCGSPVLGLLIREHGAKISYSVLASGTEFLFRSFVEFTGNFS